MSDELLRLYNSELQYVRRMGDQFARTHPQIAGHLRFGTEGDYDPYVGRLVEAFALLNARTRQKLDDEFPEIAASYLEIILPHYQRPVPSACIVGMTLDESQAEQYGGYTVPARSGIETAQIDGESCWFRTCYPVTCWPFRVAAVELRGVPFDAPEQTLASQPLGLLKITLRTQAPAITFNRFRTGRLRFCIQLPPPFGYSFYEMIMGDVLGVSVGRSADDPAAFALPERSIEAVGFGLEEGLVDYPPQSFPGYRLVSEYFAFPEKFLFFDVVLPDGFSGLEGNSVDFFFCLRKRWKELEPQVRGDSLKLGCTAAVNLFSKRAEPLRLTHFETAYAVVPDARRPLAHEIHSIDAVSGISDSGERRDFAPFYSFRHGTTGAPRGFWHARRWNLEGESELARGTEVDLSFVDLDFDPHAAGRWTIDIDTTCTSRNLAGRLPFGGGQPRLQLTVGGPVTLKCLSKPTLPARPVLGQSLRWKAVSHLALNHLSLVDDAQGATALREILALHDFRQDEVTATSIAGLVRVSSRPMLGRVPGDFSGALCRGTGITLEFDEEKFSSGNLFLFASILDRFLALYSNLNSFTQVTALSRKRQGILHRWPMRAGTQNLV